MSDDTDHDRHVRMAYKQQTWKALFESAMTAQENAYIKWASEHPLPGPVKPEIVAPAASCAACGPTISARDPMEGFVRAASAA